MTFLAALRHDRIEAPWVLDGPINGEAFKTYVEKELLKTRRQFFELCRCRAAACAACLALPQSARGADPVL
jgi:hypothetical protein